MLYCVLCDCKNASNVGAAARAIKNMGLDGLVLVRPKKDHRWLDAVKMAPGAEDILEEARIFGSLEQAVSDMHYVIGTTRRIRRCRTNIFTPKEIVSEVLKLSTGQRAAMVFGSERNGLTNQELSLCQKVVVIPTSHMLQSINLAQAVMIMAYEWHTACVANSDKENNKHKYKDLADAGQIYSLIDHSEKVLERIGFFEGHSKKIRLTLHDMLSRLDPASREVAIFQGILSRIEYCLDRHVYDKRLP